jgi:uncharacterized membrane protein
VVLVSPHSLFYDLGILTPAAVSLLGVRSVHEGSDQKATDRKVWLSIIVVLGINILALSREHFVAPPLALVTVIIFLLLVYRSVPRLLSSRTTEP